MDDKQRALHYKEDGRCQTKKTNCPFRLKFIKKPKEPITGSITNSTNVSIMQEGEYFEFFEAIHHHNHPLFFIEGQSS